MDYPQVWDQPPSGLVTPNERFCSYMRPQHRGSTRCRFGNELAMATTANLLTLRDRHGAGFVNVTGQILMAVNSFGPTLA